MQEDFLGLSERIQIAIRIGESQFREFKSALQGPPGEKAPRKHSEVMTDVGRTLVAFANADGGELLIGVEDDGSVTGVPCDENKIQQILNASSTHVHKDTPLPGVRKTKIDIDGKIVIYFYVPKGTRFVYLTSDGRCIKRIDRESVPVSSEHINNGRLEDQSRDYDRGFSPTAKLQDLDLDLVQSVASQVAYGISPEKCLQYLDLAEFSMEGLRLKNAALLLFAKDIRNWHARCQVRITSYRGKEKLSGKDFNVLKDDVVHGNVLSLVDSAWERVQVAISRQTTLSDSAKFEQSYLYPQIACREALINAIVHRNYAIEGRGIEISLFTDRLEILSPGQLLSTVSLEDLKELKGVHESRNPLIARVLREVGLIRELGEGLRRIYEVMRSNALATPEIQSDSSGFRVSLFNKSMYTEDVNLWLSNFDGIDLSESQRAVLAMGYGGKAFSSQDIIDRLGIVDVDQVREIITPLRRAGIILRDTSVDAKAKLQRTPRRQVASFTVVSPNGATQEAAPTEKSITVGNRSDDAGLGGNGIEIYVGNLPYEVSKEEIEAFCSPAGEVLSVQVPKGIGRHSTRGYAFVTIDTQLGFEEIRSALGDKDIGGRRPVVQSPRRKNPNGPVAR
ncbi:ATP-binding protein [Streptomyces parvus]|uniref:ATP-binding protein n=1 Tax=Streptomyces parvus TaxID=66428 RepID=UPI00372242FD